MRHAASWGQSCRAKVPLHRAGNGAFGVCVRYEWRRRGRWGTYLSLTNSRRGGHFHFQTLSQSLDCSGRSVAPPPPAGGSEGHTEGQTQCPIFFSGADPPGVGEGGLAQNQSVTFEQPPPRPLKRGMVGNPTRRRNDRNRTGGLGATRGKGGGRRAVRGCPSPLVAEGGH